MPKVRITVPKRSLHQDLVDAFIQDEAFRNRFSVCPVFEEGQTFVSEGWPTKPDRRHSAVVRAWRQR